MKQYKCGFRSPLGGITLSACEEGLTGLWFDGQKYFGAAIADGAEDGYLPVFDEARRWLDEYFAGHRPGFTPPLAPQGSEFRRAVWRILLTIPYGGVMTYGEIAKMLGEERGTPVSAQAVGGAVGHNPVSLIIPCHRVVGADGSLTGYAGGLDRKLKLLRLEGVNTDRFFIPKHSTAP